MNGLTFWWRERSRREQRLLLVMFALLALVAFWLLVVQPLADALDAAQRRHGEAVTRLAEARARADSTQRLESERGAPAPLPIDRFISRAGAEAGFANARVAGQGPARASFAVDAVRPQAFFAWVRLMERRGVIVETLRAQANSDRTLSVQAAFRARGAR